MLTKRMFQHADRLWATTLSPYHILSQTQTNETMDSFWVGTRKPAGILANYTSKEESAENSFPVLAFHFAIIRRNQNETKETTSNAKS